MVKKEQEQLPAVKEEAPLELYVDADYSGWGKTDIDPVTDMRTPRLVVLNGSSDAVKERLGFAGQFFNLGINRVIGESMLVIPLGYFSGRLYMEKEGQKVLCRSTDRVIGDPGGQRPNGEPTTRCAECIYSKWIGRSNPAPCAITYNYPVLYQAPQNDPAVAEMHLAERLWRGGFLSFRSTGSDTAKQINGDHEADQQPWFFHEYECTAQHRTNDRGQDWFVIKMRRTRETTSEERRYAYKTAMDLASRKLEEALVTEQIGKDDEVPF